MISAVDRLEVERDRQQHRDRRGRPDAGQHADRRAEQHADEAVEDVLGVKRGREARARGCRDSSIGAPQNREPGAEERQPQLQPDDEDEDAERRSARRRSTTAVSGRVRRLGQRGEEGGHRRASGRSPRPRTVKPKNTTASTMSDDRPPGDRPDRLTSPATSPLTTIADPEQRRARRPARAGSSPAPSAAGCRARSRATDGEGQPEHDEDPPGEEVLERAWRSPSAALTAASDGRPAAPPARWSFAASRRRPR